MVLMSQEQFIKAIGSICGDIPFLVDAAQTMGHFPIDVQEMNIDLLAFPGHKGLLGPLGIGGLILKPGVENILSPTRTGGTGSESEHPVQPTTMPDKYEVGSHNMI
ncbi:MAG TPA: aminotransferase class V-fold PLP-dependent enzyme, partial [Phycisphaerales bacterium]|nr:aminotransferase class V-fold PLP-dependent enzyme [Phycisphaerales bacterium]